MSSNYVLSICVRSYNQKDYLRQSIESILRQQVTFEYEILISDDCSTDGTIEMLREYKKKYPEKIRIILGKTNIGGPENFRRVIEASNSRYVAFMDGDDYWIDDFKLQKQYNFMISHPNYVGCFHNAFVSTNGTCSLQLFNDELMDGHITYEEIVRKRWFMPTSSEFVLREAIFFPEWYNTVPNDDYVINLSIALKGNFFYMPEVMSVYRKHSQNISTIYADKKMTYNILSRILSYYRDIYPKTAQTVFDETIKFYQTGIVDIERLKHPIRKWFYRKTYCRAIKRILTKFIY